MKTNTETNRIQSNGFAKTCIDSCHWLLNEMGAVRRSIAREFRQTFQLPEHMLRLALNEAEALAWDSGVPQLVFPDLANEKAQALVTWQRHQEEIRMHRAARLIL